MTSHEIHWTHDEYAEAYERAVRRRERQRRNPVNRLRHRLHWLRHRDQHAQLCTCRDTGRLR